MRARDAAGGSRGKAGAGLFVRFHGVRGSYPVPGPSTLRTGGNTPCVEVRAGGHLLILDAGTGIIPLGERLAGFGPETPHLEDPDQPIRCAILISHAHHDHLQGFPFFRPFYQRPNTVHLFGPRCERPFADVLRETLSSPHFPVRLGDMPCRHPMADVGTGDRIVFPAPGQDPVLLRTGEGPPAEGTVWVGIYRNPRHPDGGVLNYRIHHGDRSLVYATDTEGTPEGDGELAVFARGAGLLIHDAMYTDEEYADPHYSVRGYGHSTGAMAIAVARRAGVARLALFHHDPGRGDEAVSALEKAAQAAFPGAFAAREGLEVEI